MLKISKLADYATLMMVHMAHEPSAWHTARSLLPHMPLLGVATVVKLLKRLTKANVLLSRRGSRGGYALARLPSEITVAEMISAIDGGPHITECSQQVHHCGLQSVCRTQHSWQLINQAIFEALSAISLSDMLKDQVNTKRIRQAATQVIAFRVEEKGHG